jgi:thiamine pyrophosphate-dependent acetolactate synthase large subunit-like protein
VPETPARLGRSTAALHVLASLDKAAPRARLVVSSGPLTGDLSGVGDGPGRFYLQASGLALSLGLGVALVQPSRRVVVLQTDSDLLMELGACTCLRQLNRRNLWHVVFEVQAGAGAEGRTDLATPLGAFGYESVSRFESDDSQALRDGVAELMSHPGPGALVVTCDEGLSPLTARQGLGAADLAARFRDHGQA